MRARSALHAQRLSSVDTCIVAQIPTVTKIEPYFNQNWFSEPFCDQFWLTKPFLNHFWSYFGSGGAARNHEPPPSVIINSSATRASSGFLSSPIYDSWLCLYSTPEHPSSHPPCSSGCGRFAPCCAFALGDVKGKVFDKLSTMSTHSATVQPQALSQCAHRENLCLRPHPRPVTSSLTRRLVGQQEISASTYFLPLQAKK